MARRLVTLLMAASTLLGVATVFLWARSYGLTPDDVVIPFGGPRPWSVRSEAGRLTLFGPPLSGTVATARAAEYLAWCKDWPLLAYVARQGGKVDRVFHVFPGSIGDPDAPPPFDPFATTPADRSGPLFDALGADATFATAHWVLTCELDHRRWDYPFFGTPAEWPAAPQPVPENAVNFNGLCLRFPPERPVIKRASDPSGDSIHEPALIDPAQRSAVWGYWYRRLRLPTAEVRHAHLLAGAGVPPGLWLVGSYLYRRKRRRPGLCPHCGYDLRGNASGVCPECGSAAPKGTA